MSKFIFEGSMSGSNILVVDDDKTTANVMQLYLESFGFKVPAIAHSGREGIELAKKLKPDLVLMDIHLGRGIDGIDSAEAIMSKLDIPVVYVTAHNDEETFQRVQMSNPYGFINKPLREDDLRTTVRLALDKTKKKPVEKKTDLDAAIKKVYDLTNAETRLIIYLVDEPDIEIVAKKLHISVATVRTHLKHIYRKTDTKNLVALLHKIVTGPASLIEHSE
ncbi:MAG: response regulator [Pseudomonadota bacterium]